ncbi:MAG: substrate-binding domain-containing protein [Firmicutes bacterium]|nr:substrate-binding domain-containing protein [Bacillota bacterium]
MLYALTIAAAVALTVGLEQWDKDLHRYEGHGFEYMNGYSTTDFKGYHVYDFPGKLAKLGHKSPFIIKNEADMPILDGAEACYPLYSAAAKAVYKNIAKTEKKYNRIYGDYGYNGKIVTFSNSSKGYERLIRGDVDIFFGARPSRKQKEKAAENGEQIISIPIAKEAFVFFVEKNNPITDISSDDLRKIYSGEIKNWSELCDYDKKIIAFQRPENSGSQVMMRFFMGDAKLKAPLTYEMGMGMGDVVTKVAQYADDEGALAYSFRYFVEELGQEKNVKILSVDGVAPTLENIENGTYPILADLVCAKLESNKKANTDKMIDFMLSEDGKTLIRKTGYAPVKSGRTEIREITVITEETTED